MCAISGISLMVYLVGISMLACKTKMKVYFRMSVIIGAYMTLFLTRFLLDIVRITILDENYSDYYMKYLRIINSFASRIKWIGLYYFIVWVRRIQIKLKAQDFTDMAKKLKTE
jgi:hypothetical protein